MSDSLPKPGTLVVLKEDKSSLRTVFSVAGGKVHRHLYYRVLHSTYDDDQASVLICLAEVPGKPEGGHLWLPLKCFDIHDCWCPHRSSE